MSKKDLEQNSPQITAEEPDMPNVADEEENDKEKPSARKLLSAVVPPGLSTRLKRKTKWKKPVTITLIILVIAVVSLGTWNWFAARNALRTASATQQTSMVTRGDIAVTITGSGVMEPMAKYDIVPMVKGSILSAPFEEGDVVNKDDLLYSFDDEDLRLSIDKAVNSIKKAEISNRSNYNAMKDWTVYAPASGRLSGFSAKAGDELSANAKLGELSNDETLLVTIPFSESQLKYIYVGQSAQLTSADFMTSDIYGTVSNISNAPVRSSDGSVLYNVEITLENPGAISAGMTFTANIDGQLSPASGTAALSENQTLSAKTAGTVKSVFVKDGDWVEKGQKILELTNDSVLNTIEKSNLDYSDLQISLASQQKQLEDYQIKSPITGTVIKKDAKAGDTVGNSTTSTVLATIADMSKMKFTMDVDELDIAKIKIGQPVKVTADALPEVDLSGIITQVLQEGTSQNGVTTYPVEVTIDAPGDLKIGMNVNASVVAESKTGVLKVPIEAVQKINGKSVVLVQPSGTASGGGSRSGTPPTSASPSNTPGSGNAASGGGASRRPSGASARSGNPMTSLLSPGASGSRNSSSAGTLAAAERREVVVGISSEDETEIISGLNEGEVIYVSTASSTSTSTNIMMGPGGGMGGMGAPAGGGTMRYSTGGSGSAGRSGGTSGR